MPGWAERLCDALDEAEPQLADAARLHRNMSGPNFETALGDLIRVRGMLPLLEKLQGLGGPKPGSVLEPATASLAKTAERLGVIFRVVNETLYDLFGMNQIDDEAATAAYGELLIDWFGSPQDVVFATTNYDLSVETALSAIDGYTPNSGFRQRPGRAPILHPDGLVQWPLATAGRVPVLHLHGAVGWYGKGDQVLEQHGDQPFNASLGTPAVIYPDPNKEPRSSPVAGLWAEFEKAVTNATHILVIGHSLNDRLLVDALHQAHERVAILIYSAQRSDVEMEAEEAAVAKLLGAATLLRGGFGPQPSLTDRPMFNQWLKQRRHAAASSS
jgi:hypothetical protein